MATEMSQLTRKRGAIKHKLTSFNSFLAPIQEAFENKAAIPEKAVVDLKLRVDNLVNLLQEFEEVQLHIEYLCEEELIEREYLQRDNFTELYSSSLATSKIILDSIKLGERDSERGPAQLYQGGDAIQNIKLSVIDLPKFNGNYNMWLEFKDTFESMIHLNTSINNIQKYHYLRASLESEALKVIQSLEFSSNNYVVAWELLYNRFNNSRLLVHNHIKSLFDLESLVKESSAGLRNLIDNVNKHLRALETLKQPVKHWDTIIIFILSSKLDKQTAREWEKHKISNDFPQLDEMFKFLRTRADWLETLEINHSTKFQRDYKDKRNIKHISLASSTKKCNYCKQDHLIYNCEEFLKLDTPSKISKVQEFKLCKNCLCTGHVAKYCRYGSCKTCKRKHNTMLHVFTLAEHNGQFNNPSTSTQVALSSYSLHMPYVLLSTALVSVCDSHGKYYNVRLLLDSGSQSNFISARLCKNLNLEQRATSISLVGVNAVASSINSKCSVTVKSLYSNFMLTISCFVLPRITDPLPTSNFNISSWKIPNIYLADPKFNESSEIDLLIGAGHFWNIILNEQISLGRSLPVLRSTVFGWIFAGTINSPTKTVHCCLSKTTDLDETLRKFWEVEECPNNIHYSSDDIQCENHFVENVTRNPDGKFVVRIPLKHLPSNLGSSQDIAIKRFLQLERKLNSNLALGKQYRAFMYEYEKLGHMTLCDEVEPQQLTFFLPHHCVFKSDSLTTRLRVVFGGSSQSTSGWSLNDLQFTGPAIQNDIFSIIIRFRQFRWVVSADIEKMYRQILVHPDDRYLQNVVWRYHQDEDISIYQLNTVTYGTTSAPFLAIRCLRQLSHEMKSKYPIASKIIARDFFVDDLITGFDSENDAISVCSDIVNILETSKFVLRKWNSNSFNFMRQVQNSKEPVNLLYIGANDQTKTLGIQWNSKTDILSYRIAELSESYIVTKRSILSDIAKVYDPLGLLGPCTILGKIIIQKLWLLQLDWDQEVPDELKNRWLHFRNNISKLNELQIQRHAICSDAIKIELHGFCHASKDAYSACIYLRSTDSQNKIQVNLLCAKTKVAPLKCLTVPRLELCSAVILARLMRKVTESLTIHPKIFLWSDSQVVLHWIHTESKQLQIFVGNRVSEIQSSTKVDSWNYVNTKEHPADIASRGLSPNLLADFNMWWNGPSWLSEQNRKSGCFEQALSSCEIPELRKYVHIANTTEQFEFARFSNLSNLKRVVGYCLRFIKNSKLPKSERQFGELSASELNNSLMQLVKIAQAHTFSEEIKLLSLGKDLNKKTIIRGLAPFIDKEGFLRVGGRLKNSYLDYGAKHPLLLSGKHILTRLIFEYYHKILLHGGPQLLLATVRQKYWPTSGITTAKSVTRKCVTCFKFKPKPINPIMAHLPENRVKITNPFHITGIDYAGPFTLRDRKGRGCRFIKGYICIFICFASKAVHLEVVTDLTMESFIAVLRRFASRRGKPGHIYSDNATNFVGARKQLAILYEFLSKSNSDIVKLCANDGIVWNFIPPSSPHFGGLWESAVKSAKYHLSIVLKDTKLTYEEFNTVIVQIEAILNSRPLYPLSSDPNDLEPAHFLIGKPLTSVPDPNLVELPTNRLSRLQLLQQINQHFWRRWSGEYLSQLQERKKWKTNASGAISEGRLVTINDKNLPPCNWLLGRIIQTHPGDDGVVRVVTVQTKTGVLKRPVTKICLLPCVETNDNNTPKT